MAKYFLEVSYIVYMVAVFSRDGLEKPCREILRQEQIQLIVPQRRPFRNSLLESNHIGTRRTEACAMTEVHIFSHPEAEVRRGQYEVSLQTFF